MRETFIELLIIKNGDHIASLSITEKEWSLINFIDYIDIDANNIVIRDFNDVHANCVSLMQDFVNTALDI